MAEARHSLAAAAPAAAPASAACMRMKGSICMYDNRSGCRDNLAASAACFNPIQFFEDFHNTFVK